MASSLWQTVTNFGRPQAQKQPEQHASINNVKMDPPPKKMKAWMTALNGLDKLQQSEVDVPEPRDGEVLVRIEAVSLNYRDTEGMDGAPRRWPCSCRPASRSISSIDEPPD